MKLMVQCPQVNHHLLLPLREPMTCDVIVGTSYCNYNHMHTLFRCCDTVTFVMVVF